MCITASPVYLIKIIFWRIKRTDCLDSEISVPNCRSQDNLKTSDINELGWRWQIGYFDCFCCCKNQCPYICLGCKENLPKLFQSPSPLTFLTEIPPQYGTPCDFLRRSPCRRHNSLILACHGAKRLVGCTLRLLTITRPKDDLSLDAASWYVPLDLVQGILENSLICPVKSREVYEKFGISHEELASFSEAPMTFEYIQRTSMVQVGDAKRLSSSMFRIICSNLQ